jgi:hypothetical protein|tara:strand:- start:246 stop:377 length:132 start_codon:yes stop_codon:yes gene_type:complete
MKQPIPPHMIFLLAQKSSQGKALLKQLDMIWMKLEKLITKEMK